MTSASCHMGNSIIYDTVTKCNWSVDVRTHPIKFIINELLAKDWDVPQNGSAVNSMAVPTAKPEDDCVVSAVSDVMVISKAQVFKFLLCRSVLVGSMAISLTETSGDDVGIVCECPWDYRD